MSKSRWLSGRWSSFVCLRISPVMCWILGEILGPSSDSLGEGMSLFPTLLSLFDCLAAAALG